ncbi:MAG: hypothetical protein LBT90_03400 [Holosporaceae bacterium]|nr:hypothetical protein [Holosporaceae bacterium]
MKDFYKRLRNEGKNAFIALTAAARKLLVILIPFLIIDFLWQALDDFAPRLLKKFRIICSEEWYKLTFSS